MIKVVDSSVHRKLYSLAEKANTLDEFLHLVSEFMDKVSEQEIEFKWGYEVSLGDPTSGDLKFIKVSWVHCSLPYREVHCACFYSD